MKPVVAVAAATAVVALVAGCSSHEIPAVAAAQKAQQAAQAARQAARTAEQAAEAAGLATKGGPVVVRLGLVDDMADVSGMVGVQMGYFRGELGQGVELDPVTFTSDAQEALALESGQLNAAYVDPLTAVQLWQAHGSLIKIVAGGASGGSELVAAKSITSAAQLAGRAVAVPSGSEQAAALGTWLHQQRVSAAGAGAADLSSAAAVSAFGRGAVAAAWEPAPFDAEMAADGGHVLASDAGPAAQFASAELVVTQRMLSADPAAVRGLLKGEMLADDLITYNKPAAQAVTGNEFAALLGHSLPSSILQGSFTQVTATSNPLQPSVLAEADQAAALGLLKPVRSLAGLYDLTLLDAVQRANGQSAQLPGLGG
jgi:NitT/TauT family transport system substrate-binding protein